METNIKKFDFFYPIFTEDRELIRIPYTIEFNFVEKTVRVGEVNTFSSISKFARSHKVRKLEFEQIFQYRFFENLYVDVLIIIFETRNGKRKRLRIKSVKGDKGIRELVTFLKEFYPRAELKAKSELHARFMMREPGTKGYILMFYITLFIVLSSLILVDYLRGYKTLMGCLLEIGGIGLIIVLVGIASLCFLKRQLS